MNIKYDYKLLKLSTVIMIFSHTIVNLIDYVLLVLLLFCHLYIFILTDIIISITIFTFASNEPIKRKPANDRGLCPRGAPPHSQPT